MNDSLLNIYIEAWREPRKSIRRILSLGIEEKDRLLMLAANLVLTSAAIALMVRSHPEGPMAQTLEAVPTVPRYMIFALATYLGYRLSSFLLKSIGTAFGGTATNDACRTTNAWWMLVTSVVTFAEAILSLVIPLPVLSIVNFIATIASIAIFSAYVAEVHGFQSVLRVAGVVVAVMLSVILILNIFVLALVPQ